jgi:predicted ATPase/DNA-binding winged helix-turn-helix (wHTH) protein
MTGEGGSHEEGWLRFGDVEINAAAMDLRRGGERVAVEPQVFDVLRLLVQHRGRVVPKEEILDVVWGNRFVSESALTSRVRSARQAVGDDGQRQQVIRTVHGRGYQLVAEVVPLDHAGDDASAYTRPAGAGTRVPIGLVRATVAAPVKDLVDRVDLLARIVELIEPRRVVTLVGPAGVGKTLLAEHAVARASGGLADGGWAVRLAEIRTGSAVAQSVLDAVGGTRYPAGTADATVVDLLTRAEAVVLLDNCEHVLDETAALVLRLLEADARVAVLATSRQRLGVPGEVVVDVPVLEPAYAVELFTRRAAENGVDVSDRAERVEELCASLDQLPLAVELASARARVLGINELANLLDERLRLLGSVPGDPSQTTLEGAIETSWVELSDELRETLSRFAQFAGWFDLPAATAVACAGRDLDPVDAVHHVIDLAERSLLDRDSAASGTRYRLLESIRLFADARSVERDDARRAHVRCHRDRALELGRDLAGPEVERAWHDTRLLWPDFRAAIRYALELRMVDDALDLLASTIDYAEVAFAFEHGSWADEVLAAAEAAAAHPDKVREVRAGRARLHSYERHLEELATLVDASGSPQASFGVALATFWRHGAFGEHQGLADSFALLERHTAGTGGLRELIVGAVAHLAAHSPDVDPTAASRRALRVGRATGQIGRAFALAIEANLAVTEGRTDDALAACRECIDVSQRVSAAAVTSQAQALRVRAVREHPDLTVVGLCVLEAMRFYRARGNWASARNDAPVAARVIAHAGMPELAADVLDGYRPVGYRSPDRAYLSRVRELLGDAGTQAPIAEPGQVDDDSPWFVDQVVNALEKAVAAPAGSPTAPVDGDPPAGGVPG